MAHACMPFSCQWWGLQIIEWSVVTDAILYWVWYSCEKLVNEAVSIQLKVCFQAKQSPKLQKSLVVCHQLNSCILTKFHVAINYVASQGIGARGFWIRGKSLWPIQSLLKFDSVPMYKAWRRVTCRIAASLGLRRLPLFKSCLALSTEPLAFSHIAHPKWMYLDFGLACNNSLVWSTYKSQRRWDCICKWSSYQSYLDKWHITLSWAILMIAWNSWM